MLGPKSLAWGLEVGVEADVDGMEDGQRVKCRVEEYEKDSPPAITQSIQICVYDTALTCKFMG